MNEEPNVVSSSEIELIKSDTFVRTIESYRKLPSTNDLALQRATCKELDTPLLVLTEIQTAGRGRGSNQWWSSPGALTFSLLIDTKDSELRVGGDPRLSLATALSVRDAFRKILTGGDIQLKWPNDVYIGSRKVAGILLERSSISPDRLAVGIGINVNNSMSAAPDEIRTRATSLHDTSGSHFPLCDVLTTILKQIAIRFRMLTAEDSWLAEEWENSCLLHNRIVQVKSGKRLIEGVCHGIDEQGALVIDTQSGLQRLVSGVVLRFD